MHPNSSPLAEAERQLELQRQLIVALTPELYRQLALYLQVLRKGLLHSVQQACFHLATQTYPERFSAIGASRRLELQRVTAGAAQIGPPQRPNRGSVGTALTV